MFNTPLKMAIAIHNFFVALFFTFGWLAKDKDNDPRVLDDGGGDVGGVLQRQLQQPFLLLMQKKNLCPMTHESLLLKMSRKRNLRTFLLGTGYLESGKMKPKKKRMMAMSIHHLQHFQYQHYLRVMMVILPQYYFLH